MAPHHLFVAEGGGGSFSSDLEGVPCLAVSFVIWAHLDHSAIVVTSFPETHTQCNEAKLPCPLWVGEALQ